MGLVEHGEPHMNALTQYSSVQFFQVIPDLADSTGPSRGASPGPVPSLTPSSSPSIPSSMAALMGPMNRASI